MKLSELIQIGSTLTLGLVAVFGPLVTNWLRRRIWAPALSIAYEHKEPHSLKAEYRSLIDANVSPEPVYHFQLQIKNEGKSVAKYCEATIEELWRFDAARTPVKVVPFTPVYLMIQGASPVRPGGQMMVDINPKRTLYSSLGHVSSRSYQTREERQKFIPTPAKDDTELRFLLDTVASPFHQPNSFAKGSYIFKVSLYSENAGHHFVCLQLDGTGNWKDETRDMFNEIVIKQVSCPTEAVSA